MSLYHLMTSSDSDEIDYYSSDEEFPPPGVRATQFRSHLEQLQMLDGDETGLDIEFTRLENKSLRAQLAEDFETACEALNKNKNRYANVLPPERTRVKLKPTEDNSDYINANYIGGAEGPRTYIASQGPLRNTSNDFWRMMWEEKSDVVVMLTRLRENGRLKCHEYWPSEGGNYHQYSVTLRDVSGDSELVERTFIIRDTETNEERTVAHFQYAEWPDHGLPTCTIKFREMLRQVDRRHTSGPIVVHCSAGIGRTGTFCVVHSTIHELKEKGIENYTINVPETVLRLRSERTGMVQTREQYEFCYMAILEEIEDLATQQASDLPLDS